MVTVLAAVQAGPSLSLAAGDTEIITIFAKVGRRCIVHAKGRLNENEHQARG